MVCETKFGVGLSLCTSRRLARGWPPIPTPNFVSHTTPLTVFAELGVIGLALYAWLLAGTTVLILRLRGREEALALALGVTFLGLFTHALFYSGFLEDPLTWLVVGITAAYAAQPVERRRRREVAAA